MLELLVLALLVGGARLLAPRLGLRSLLDLTGDLARRLASARRTPPEVPAVARRAGDLTERASRAVPGSTCLHRAVAANLFLSAYGVEARVAVGLRHHGELQGHAWVEVPIDNGILLMFSEDGDYRRLFDESPRGGVDDLLPAPRACRSD